MAKLFAKLLINALALLLAAYLIPSVGVTSFGMAILVALVLGIVNVTLRPILIFLTFPITFLTLGLFMFVIDGLLLFLVAGLLPGFEVSGFGAAILAAIIVTVLGYLGEQVIEKLEEK